MRKTVRLFSEVGPEERLAAAIRTLPPAAQRSLADVAQREDLPLVAGSWATDDGGCLVANVVATLGSAEQPADTDLTLDIRVLRLFPELSSRDLNRLIVAWDEAALQEGRGGDGALRRLLRGALARAGVALDDDSDRLTAEAARIAVAGAGGPEGRAGVRDSAATAQAGALPRT